ncbi:uncharacterized protein LOC134824088 isoform X1 [Bolinopsis microptera]
MAQEVGNWVEIRLFISSTFVDTQAERDVLVKRVIPSINRKMADRFIRIVPVDLRWGVLAEESKDCHTIQKTCLNQVDKCRLTPQQTPWFLGLRTSRYGWVQNDMMPSHGFENPDLFKWIDEFASSGRTGVSITSLECIHAVQNPSKMLSSPTVFFYQRNIDEGPLEEQYIEKNMRWVFDFEYKEADEEIPEDSKYQYSKTEEAGKFANDLKNLNKYLQDIPHVKWNEFEVSYEHGGAKFTCKREGAKSFGVGYTSSLEAFEDQVEKDLIEAIQENFKSDSSSINDFQMETVQHENAIQLKASTFVGRTALVEDCTVHCETSVDDRNVMILHGEPGCGKSGLLAAVTHGVTKPSRESGNFVFIHVVDSCPGSNVLEQMLRRLQWALRDFRRGNGEINISSDPPQSASDLRAEHHNFLTATAEKYSNKRFLIVVDAVNQFHEGMKAWDMWWLPRKETTSNVRCMISTLNKENGTFDNAQEAYPDAVLTPVLQMSDDDLEGMVSATLARFNKKLTTYDDSLLGNQMEVLLSKSASPLYLIACCEALRKFGIFERVSQYIKDFPTTITELFSFLLDDWSEEYGKMFVEDVAGLICCSKDGLLENEINDLLAFKEERDRGDEEYLYDSSFSRIYDSLASFLAAGGGGYLRFFHDQLKYTIKDKFLNDDFALETNQWLSDFFFSCTESQLCEEPEEDPAAYYEHVLQQLVYHQLKATPKSDKLTALDSTLRNIYFVRERILYRQSQDLMDEYELAIKRCFKNHVNLEISTALTQWKKFVQMYAAKIEEFPQFARNMAVTQAPTSWVTKDTNKLDTPPSKVGYPLIWENIPAGEDSMVCKYTSVGRTCGMDVAASTPSGDIVAIAAGDEALILDQSSGEIQHRLKTSSYSIALSPDFERVYNGGSEGISVWDVGTGSKIAETGEDFKMDDVVVWIQHIGSFIATGTGHARKAIRWDVHNTSGGIALFPVDHSDILVPSEKWDVGAPCYDYCYLSCREWIFAANKGEVRGFDLGGEEVVKLTGAGRCCYAVASHPTEPTILSGSNDLVIREWNVDSQTLVRTITDTTSSGWAFGGNWSVSYDPTGCYVLSTEPDSKSLRLYTFEGNFVDEMKGHADCINKIKIVPGTQQALTSDRGRATLMFNIPNPEDGVPKAGQDIDEKVFWTGFCKDGDFLFTISNEAIRKWNAKSLELLISKEFDGFHRTKGFLTCDEKWVYGSGRVGVTRFSFEDLNVGGYLEVLPDPDGSLSDFSVTRDESKLLVTECKNMKLDSSYAFVYDISDFDAAEEINKYDKYGGRMFACDTHSDNMRGVVSGHNGTHVFTLTTCEVLFSIPRGCWWVCFMELSDRLAYSAGDSVYVCDVESGEDVLKLEGHKEDVNGGALVRGETEIYTSSADGTIKLFDLEKEECIYTFFNHRARQYTKVGASPCGEKVAVGNENGMLYVLKSGNYQ